MIRPFAAALGLALAAAAPATADPLSEASQAMCAQAKSCALQEMEGAEGMSEAVKAQITQGLDSMCVAMEENFAAVAQYHELYDPAVACLNSMAALSCAELEAMDANGTPACQEYERLAEKYR
ncbi:hypothetical protein N1F89_15000 [Aquibium sp. A9E412]|uniref:hypothetical protein n=1 Tax=Aquibium sp. A9E412 TaxID=2976767 RepID=UPI0025B1667E|nr:hypothetical protein [Aquibium sp. A9E412]MDN2567529.1 hypothetical protein [Aquibium sp. A9E412]